VALKRIVPCLLYDGKGLVKTVKFKNPSYVGDPINAIKIFNDKEVDELVLLDIMASRERRQPNFDKIADMASEAFMPFAYGGGVKTYDDFARLFRMGVEKVIVNSLIQENPSVIKRVVSDYGAQAVVGCIDFKKKFLGDKAPWSYMGHKIKYDLQSYALYLEMELGLGEILLYSADRDGTWEGFDYDVIQRVLKQNTVPIIACGGCGSVADLRKVLYEIGADGAAFGSMAVYSKKGMGVLINFPDRSEVIREY
jgi:cyclase